MPLLELFDETLDINSTENYDLSVQVSISGLSFCLLDSIRNKYVLIRSYESEDNRNYNAEKINDILGRDDFLLRRYRKVNIVMPSGRFTMVPSALFDPGKKDEYFKFNHHENTDEIIISNRFSDPDSFIVFSVPGQLYELITGHYPGRHPFHHVRVLLQHISHFRKNVPGNYIHLHVEREFFNLIIFSHNQLKLCNSFNYRNITDIMYFVLNVIRKLGIKQEETIHLSGMTEKYDDLSSNLAIYIRNIKFAEPAGNFTFSYVFNDTALHRFLNLFTVTNCEL